MKRGSHICSTTMWRSKKPDVVTLSDEEEMPIEMDQEMNAKCIVLSDSKDALPSLVNKEAEPKSRKRMRSRNRRGRAKKKKGKNLSTKQMIQEIKLQLPFPMHPTESQPISSNTATQKEAKKRRRNEPMFVDATKHTTHEDEVKSDPRVPQKWTNKMAHFYCDLIPELANLSLDEELAKMSNKGWEVTEVEQKRALYLSPRKAHYQRNICHLCGVPGHRASQCQFKFCSQCGGEEASPSVGCYHCVAVPEAREPCGVCKKLGHTPRNCDDNWRMFASSTDPGEIPLCVPAQEKPACDMYCCNCAKKGHTSEDCGEPTMEQLLESMYTEEKRKLLDNKRKRRRGRRGRGNARGSYYGGCK